MRLTDDVEAVREAWEGELARLGNARILLKLVRERVRHAAVRQCELLSPALDDLVQIDGLLRQVQRQIGDHIADEIK